MITAVMQAARDYVRDKMIADATLSNSFKELTELTELGGDPSALPDGYTLYEVRGVIETSEMPEERHTVYVKARETQNDLERLKDWMIEVSVGSPVDVPGVGVETHSALELAVDRIWNKSLHPTAEAELTAEIEAAAPGFTGGGFHAQGWEEAREGTELLPVYVVKAGVQRV